MTTSRRPWSPADTATLTRMARAGYSDGEIGQHLGRDRSEVGRKRREMNVRPGVSAAGIAMMARINARRLCLTLRTIS